MLNELERFVRMRIDYKMSAEDLDFNAAQIKIILARLTDIRIRKEAEKEERERKAYIKKHGIDVVGKIKAAVDQIGEAKREMQ